MSTPHEPPDIASTSAGRSARRVTIFAICVVTALIVGMGLIIGLPALNKHEGQAQTIEALHEIDRIYKRSAQYFATPHLGPNGENLPCQFPEPQTMTPDITNKACCGGAMDIDKDNRCDVDKGLWTSPTWTALSFQMTESHRYGYTYQSEGVGDSSKFTATANGDLDCDGTLSMFQRTGLANSAVEGKCMLSTQSPFTTSRETE